MNICVKVFYVGVRRAVALVSGGKDSVYALHLSLTQGFDVEECITFLPPPEAMLFHHPNTQHAHVICSALGIPHRYVEAVQEEEALTRTLEKTEAEWLVVGATASEYQRMVFNFAAERVGKKLHTPLWHVDHERLIRRIVEEGFRFVIVFAGAYGMERWLGVEIGPDNVDAFLEEARKAGINPAGEGGEYESFVVQLPGRRLEYCGHVEGRHFIIDEIKV